MPSETALEKKIGVFSSGYSDRVSPLACGARVFLFSVGNLMGLCM